MSRVNRVHFPQVAIAHQAVAIAHQAVAIHSSVHGSLEYREHRHLYGDRAATVQGLLEGLMVEKWRGDLE
jgi:hypothetical protein